ncbi:hypothetical protein OIO90_004482 [Microbotryomycetes sp. JL221]|nr:hypothetical protein OIO90_004482 [Microbotryomycetes sp. JL221]
MTHTRTRRSTTTTSTNDTRRFASMPTSKSRHTTAATSRQSQNMTTLFRQEVATLLSSAPVDLLKRYNHSSSSVYSNESLIQQLACFERVSTSGLQETVQLSQLKGTNEMWVTRTEGGKEWFPRLGRVTKRVREVDQDDQHSDDDRYDDGDDVEQDQNIESTTNRHQQRRRKTNHQTNKDKVRDDDVDIEFVERRKTKQSNRRRHRHEQENDEDDDDTMMDTMTMKQKRRSNRNRSHVNDTMESIDEDDGNLTVREEEDDDDNERVEKRRPSGAGHTKRSSVNKTTTTKRSTRTSRRAASVVAQSDDDHDTNRPLQVEPSLTEDDLTSLCGRVDNLDVESQLDSTESTADAAALTIELESCVRQD